MTELIRNGELLRTVRAKINATINPFPSRAAFELAFINAEVSMVYVIEGGDVYRLVRGSGEGAWASGDGASWIALIEAGLPAGALFQAVADAETARDEAQEAAAGLLQIINVVVVDEASEIPEPPAENTLYLVRA